MNIIDKGLKFNGLDYGNKPEYIILHHADAKTCTVEDIHRWHQGRGWSGIGYHYFIRKDGSIYRGRPENAIGAHCPGYNQKSIGISVEGSYTTETMPEVQKNAVIKLIKDIMKRYTIKDIHRHGDVYATTCPGKNYPFDEIKAKALAKEEVKSANATTTKMQLTYKQPLKYGMTANEVKELQRALEILGYFKYPKLTTYFGDVTLNAVKAFQKDNGLAVDGIAGPATHKAINVALMKK